MLDLIAEFARNRQRIPWEFSDMEEREESGWPRGMRVLEQHEMEGDLFNEESVGIYVTKPIGVGLLEYLSDEVVDAV